MTKKKECIGCAFYSIFRDEGASYPECLKGYSIAEGSEKCNEQEYI